MQLLTRAQYAKKMKVYHATVYRWIATELLDPVWEGVKMPKIPSNAKRSVNKD